MPWLVGTASTAAALLAAAWFGQAWFRRQPGRWLPGALLAAATLVAGATLHVLELRLGPWGGVAGEYLAGLRGLSERLHLVPAVVAGYVSTLSVLRLYGCTFILLIALALLPRRWVGPLPSPALAWLLLLAAPAPLLPFLLAPQEDLQQHLRSSMDRLLLHWVGPAWLAIGAWTAPWLPAALVRRWQRGSR